jgi:hypothetical protein
MGLIADLRVLSETLPLVDVAAAVPDATLTVESMQANPTGPPAFVVSVTGDPVGVDDAFAAADSVTDHSLVVEGGTTRPLRTTAPCTVTSRRPTAGGGRRYKTPNQLGSGLPEGCP